MLWLMLLTTIYWAVGEVGLMFLKENNFIFESEVDGAIHRAAGK
jgi:hypothetical protein